MSEVSLNTIQMHRALREAEEQKRRNLKKQLIVLVLHYLQEEGYVATADTFRREVPFDVGCFSVCDNIDLGILLVEYINYYVIRFQRAPQIIKKVVPPSNENLYQSGKLRQGLTKSSKTRHTAMRDDHHKELASREKVSANTEFIIQGSNPAKPVTCNKDSDEGILLSSPLSHYTDEWRAMADLILKDFSRQHPNVHWADVIGHDNVKCLLKEAVIYPSKFPELFTGGILMPWNGILLYGPSGTGKTMLAEAVATEYKCAFFNISAATLVSKWRGESEKLVQVLFDLAHLHAPSIIFIDEIDSLLSQRCQAAGEHEASRRLKTQLIIEMDRLAKSSKMAFFLAASNLPWDLDHALLRRLEKRILVPLPSLDHRVQMFQRLLPAKLVGSASIELTTTIDYHKIAQETEGYSGAEIRAICKEAAMQSLRKVIDFLEEGIKNTVKLDPLTTSDVLDAIAGTKPLSSLEEEKYVRWQQNHGST